MADDIEAMKYAPKQYQPPQQFDPDEEVIVRSVEVLQSMRVEINTLKIKNEELRIANGVLERRDGDQQVEIEQLKTDLRIAKDETAMAYRERDIAIGYLHQHARISVAADLSPPPAVRKRKRNGEPTFTEPQAIDAGGEAPAVVVEKTNG